ncbi:MAG: CpaF family protein [Myxococcota bacterium]
MDLAPVVTALRTRLTRDLSQLDPGQMDADAIEQLVARFFGELERQGVDVPPADRHRAADAAWDAVLGVGPLAEPMHDPTVSEIMVNGPHRVFVEREGVTSLTPLRFRDEDELRLFVQRMLVLAPGKRLDTSTPWVDLSLPGGTRVNVCIPPIVAGGPHVTVRKYLRSLDTLEEVVAKGTMDARMARLLASAVRARAGILFSGAAGTGKTTLLEVAAKHVPARERIVVIEDTLELHFYQPDVVRLLTRISNVEGRGEVTIGDLFRNSLRMRPDRIVLGEIRGKEALDYLQALNSGHRGTLAVIHAASPEEAVVRLENLVPLAGLGVPFQVTRQQIAQGLDLVVQLSRWPDGVRRVDRVAEVSGLAHDGTVALRDLFVFRAEGADEDGRVRGRFVSTGVAPKLWRACALAGVPLSEADYRDE